MNILVAVIAIAAIILLITGGVVPTLNFLLWVGIVALFYFCHGVVAAWAIPAARLPALLEALLCVVLIGALGRDARRRPGA